MAEIQVYDSFAEMPLDPEPEWEGDDSLGMDERLRPRALFAANLVTTPDVYRLVVPYPGLIHEGMRGDPVYGVKRIVHRYAHTLSVLQAAPQGQRRRWGPMFTIKLRRAQKRAGVEATGVWDRATHAALAPWADTYAIDLLNVAPTVQEIQTAKLMSFLMGFYNRRYQIRYSQARPTQLRPVSKITEADCSGSVAAGMWTAGILPKVDWRYTNTDVQIMLGKPVSSLEQVRLGDVALYGFGTDPGHETCVVSVENGIRVFSFGSYPARLLNIDYDRGSLGKRIAIRRFIT